MGYVNLPRNCSLMVRAAGCYRNGQKFLGKAERTQVFHFRYCYPLLKTNDERDRRPNFAALEVGSSS